MGLILQYVVQTNAGSWHYRRRVPASLREVVGKSELKRKLGDTRQEALRAYPLVHREFETLLGEARSPKRQVLAGQASTELEIYQEAKGLAARISEGGVSVGGELLRSGENNEDGWTIADVFEDAIIGKLKVDRDGDPIGGDPVEAAALSILRSSGQAHRPKPTILDAKRLYLKERIVGDVNEHRKMLGVERAVGHLTSAGLSDHTQLETLKREDARAVRDRMLCDLRMTPSTVRRVMNDIRAIINFGFTEFDIKDATNPFHNLEIKSTTVGREERLPIPPVTLRNIRHRLSECANSTYWQIWRLLEGTGCRLAEVVGLLVADVHLDCPVPYIDLVHHEHRRLKNNASVRRVPLVGEALEVMKAVMNEARGGVYLFPRYAERRGSDRVSAGLMKHVRTVTDNPKVTVHSLRHSMEDKLLSAGVETFDRNLVLGHSSGGMGERYGGASARLEAAYRALARLK